MKFCFYLLLAAVLFGSAQMNSAQTKAKQPPAKYGCLPRDIRPDTVTEVKKVAWRGGIRLIKETVGQRLDKMNARCKAGKLVDQKGTEIRFHRLQGCWGNPPADYLEIMEGERKLLRDLRKKFTVIEITCNPSGFDPA